MSNYSNPVAIGDIGTQVFWFNNRYVETTVTSSTFASLKSSLYIKNASGEYVKLANDATYDNSETYYTIPNKFEYAVPVTAGGEFGGDTESFDAPETDLDYVPKIAGRTTLNDIAYTSNYTKEKYARIADITGNNTLQTYMEVFSDGSATLFRGTSGRPTITAGDVRQINWTVVPQFMLWIEDIYDLSDSEIEKLDETMYTTTAGTSALNIDVDSIPTERPEYYAKANA